MTGHAVATIDALPSISLDDLVIQAALLDRMDRKYLVPRVQLDDLVAAIGPGAQVLDIAGRRDFGYESVYFDTPDLLCYHLAAHRRRRRFKLRTRTYLDSAECWFEVKTRDGRGRTVKSRRPHESAHPAVVDPETAVFAERAISTAGLDRRTGLVVAPVMTTSYRRTTLFLPASRSRVTIDTDLRWAIDGHRELRLPELAIVETKTADRLSEVDHLLWRRRCRPSRVSKYGTGLAALRPELPSTTWNRTLRRHFER
ncbi:polyphosphate polymerase domain-containing protein [Nakamurella leprariae]|uniref:Polyphosphate polymerase domain-containing protein n=1 Tax=Nakamurella leprariae TaxID=2803911 RepID=A0A939BXC8_9ACTN|nr:polyphosphate polymerase domain-containing protein [Nakamurella leprariae]MBM9468428.1 polyphosphate polymerase domain-containing protein [Nakamurella leprariae]